jgi:hypothetical protein
MFSIIDFTIFGSCSKISENDTERLKYLFKQYEIMIKKDTVFTKQKKTHSKKANAKPLIVNSLTI